MTTNEGIKALEALNQIDKTLRRHGDALARAMPEMVAPMNSAEPGNEITADVAQAFIATAITTLIVAGSLLRAGSAPETAAKFNELVEARGQDMQAGTFLTELHGIVNTQIAESFGTRKIPADRRPVTAEVSATPTPTMH